MNIRVPMLDDIINKSSFNLQGNKYIWGMQFQEQLKVAKINDNAHIPEYKSDDAAGADLYSCEYHNIAPGETVVVGLGIKTEFDPDYVALIFARSGLATKKGLAPANKVGVIDSDYRGEWKVALHNHSNDFQEVNIGDRIAQMLIVPVVHPMITEVSEDELEDTERGEGGFGHSGN